MTSSPLPADLAAGSPLALPSTQPMTEAGPPAGAPIDGSRLPTPDDQVETVGGESVRVPHDQDGINALRLEIDRIDAELVRLIQRRSAVSHAIGAARRSLGGPRIVYSREMAILERFRELGPEGTDLGMMLLAMGRGRLGRR